MALEIATAYVSIIPSARDFTKKLRTQIGKVPDIAIGVTANSKGFAKSLASLTRKQPTIKIPVVADTKGFAKSISAVSRTKAGGIKVPVSADTKGFTRQLSQATQRSGRAVRVPVSADTKGFRGQLNTATRANPIRIPVSANTTRFGRDMETTRSANGKVLYVPVNPKTDGFASKLHALIGNQSGVGSAMGASAGSSLASSLLSAAKTAAVGMAAIFAAHKIIDVGKEAFTQAADFETTRVSFEGLLGSAEAAQTALHDLQQFAKTTPFDFPEIVNAGKKLLAFGFDAGSIIPTMTKVGNAASALGATGYDVNLVVRALGQIGSKGRVQLEELNQIAEAFPGTHSIRALAEAMGVTEAEFTNQLSKPGGALTAYGLTGSKAVEILIDSFDDVPGAMGAMERQSKTLNGAMSNLKDSFRILAIDAIEPVRPILVDFLLNKVLPAVTKLTEDIPPLVTKAVAKLQELKTAFTTELDGVGVPGSTGLGRIADIFAHIGDFIGRVRRYIKLFKTEADGVGVPAGLSGLEGVFAHLGDWVGKVRDGWRIFKTEMDGVGVPEGLTGMQATFASLGDLFGRIRDAIPVFMDGVRGIEVPDGTSALKNAFFDIGRFAHDTFVNVKDLVGWLIDNKDTLIPIAVSVTALAVAYGKLHTAMSLVSTITSTITTLLPLLLSPVGIALAAIAVLGTAFYLAYQKIEPFREAVDHVIDAFRKGFKKKPEPLNADPLPIEATAPEEGLVGGLKAAIPEVLAQLVILKDKFGEWMENTGLPWIKTKLHDWAFAFGNWIEEEAVPWLVTNMPKILDAIGQWVRDNEPLLMEKLSAWSEVFFKWLNEDAIPKLKEKLPGIMADLMTAIVPAMNDLMFNMGMAMLDGIGRLAILFITEWVWGVLYKWPIAAGEFIASFIAELVKNFTEMIPGDIDSFLRFFQELPAKIAGAVHGMWDVLGEGFINVLNSMITAWNGFELNIDVPDNKLTQILGIAGKGFTISTGDIDLIRLAKNATEGGAPQRHAFASGAVLAKRFDGNVTMAETRAARPEIVTPQRLMAQTFRDVMSSVGMGAGGGLSIGTVELINPVDATADEVVDAFNARLGWMLTTRGER